MVTTLTTKRADGARPCGASDARAQRQIDAARAALRRGWLVVSCVAAFVTAAVPVHAQTWRIVPSLTLESTLTDNVDLSPSGERKADWINQLTPAIRFSESGGRTKLSGAISLPVILYARTSENDYVAPEASVTGTVEAIDQFLFVDASVNVSQQYLSPFGARPTTLSNASQNRYTAQSYSVSPYVKGTPSQGLSYEVRQRSIWSDAAGVSAGTASNRAFTSTVDARVSRSPQPGGWAFDYSRSDVDFQDRNSESTQIARARALYGADPSLQVSATAGYEDNRFVASRERGATYGAGIVWHPTDRTNLDATWEHRFFGGSYSVAFDHHTPLTVWSARASRDTSSYPQQLATLTPGIDVGVLLNGLFASRIVDAVQRQALVDQLMRDRGLPSQLSGPLTLYSQQITLIESLTATAGVIGARNVVFVTAFRTRNEPLQQTDEALSPLLQLLTNNTQTGANVAWTHQLTPTLTFAANATWSRATQNGGGEGSTTQYSLRTTVSHPLSAQTSVYAGARFQHSDSDVGFSYRELAVLVGLTHTFH
jgi:uncharacterized protein (PEP-CTERM system associated)